MDIRDSYLGKRSFSELVELTSQQKPEEDDVPIKKKLRTKLVDLFNRASISMATPEDYIKVYLRIKPFTQDENASQRCFEVAEEDNSVMATAPEMSHANRNMKRGLGNSSHKFTFSRIFNENTSQGDFFNATMLGMTKDFISGQNSLVFTYGVTSSGKTYTIQGQAQNAGILPRCLDVIFNSISGKQMPNLTTLKPHMFTDVVKLSPSEVVLEKKTKERTLKLSIDDDTTVMTLLGDEMESALSDTATSSSSACGDDLFPHYENRDREKLKVDVEDQGKIRFGVWVSFAEIYNEQIFDLLEPFPRKKNAKRPVLKICDDRNGSPYIKGLKEIHVESADEAYRLLTIGQRNLQTACTRLNQCSSRSHCVFNIKIVRVDKEDPHNAKVSILSLCDLAGSERYSKTQATGDRLKEAGNINASLMTLGRCIETLRHNQLHRDQQRLVPFRDSKLTRLLQNYFTGNGRAVMIVNVSQCASMFDDTLHVFKFSAIAKQVKYIEKPPEPPKKLKEKKVIPPAQRPSIEWEVQAPTENAVLKDALNKPLPDGDEDIDDLPEIVDEDDQDENISDNCRDMKEVKIYIKSLELRNERLMEMLHEEMVAASNIETRVRKEVTQTMMKQVVNIEEMYSTLLKETNEEAQELADERVKGIMAVYEQRLERIQRKVDEEDEWVSSLLYHQEQLKTEARDAEIVDLKKEIEELKAKIADSKARDTEVVDLKKEIEELKAEIADSKNKCTDDSVDIGNSAFIETLTHKLQEANNLCKEKDIKIEELESLISEAGDVYNNHMEEITKLTEQKGKLENQLSSLQNSESQLKEITATFDALRQSLKDKEAEWKSLEEKLNKNIESKSATISSLQDECKELQDEIERLQDQMSQMDEHSKYRNDLEMSACSEHRLVAPDDADSSKHVDTSSSLLKQELVNEPQKMDKHSAANGSRDELSTDPVIELVHLKEEVAKKDKEADLLKLAIEELEKQIERMQSETDSLVQEIAIAKEKYEKSTADTKILQKTLEQMKKDLDCARQSDMKTEEKIASTHQISQQISNELESLKKVNMELTKKVQALENQQENCGKQSIDHPGNEDDDTNEQITLQFPKKDKKTIFDTEVINQSSDNEIIFNTKMTSHESVRQESDKLRKENEALQKVNAELTERVQALEDQLKNETEEHIAESDNRDVNIAAIVKQIEHKTTSVSQRSISGNRDSDHMGQVDETEVLSNQKVISKQSSEVESSAEMLKTPSTGISQSKIRLGQASRLKDAELANAALRSKLKREEEDYFKREQALIHGYTAEIEHLKYELAKLKSQKVDAPSRILPRGKRKVAIMEISISDSIDEISILGDSKLVNIKEDSSKEKQSVDILSNEVLSIQEQLLSLSAAYRKLQTFGKRKRTNSFIQDVVLGTPNNRQTAMGVFRSEDNVADSILQFELDEYAMKIDDMKNKLSQQDSEIKIYKSEFDKIKAEKLEIEHTLREVLKSQESRQEDEISKIQGALEKEPALKNTIEQKLQERDCAYSQLHSEVKEHQEMVKQLKETLESTVTAKNEVEQKLTDLTEQLLSGKEELQNVVMELNKLQEIAEITKSERDSLMQTVSNLRENQNLQGRQADGIELELTRSQNLLKETECALKLSKEDLCKLEKRLQESEVKLADAVTEKSTLEESFKSKCEELITLKEKISILEEKYNDVKETLEKTISIKDDIESKLKCANEKLAAGKETLNKQKEEYECRINVLKEEFSGEGRAKLENITKLEKCIDDLQLQLQRKTAELERFECQRQEEGAEVSQKLLMLEREKKLAERRAADAKEKELEWQLKCQGLDYMKQLEEQLHQQLRTAAETVRKHSMKTTELKDELASMDKELDKLRQEQLPKQTSSIMKTQELEFKIQELEQALASEKEKRMQADKNYQDYVNKFNILKTSLAESEEITEQQEKIINKQDHDLDILKTKLDTLMAEQDRLERLVTQKEFETANLNKQISQLEVKMTVFQQTERETLGVEQICHQQLQKSNSEKRELEERIHKLETENVNLEGKLNTSEEQMKKERKVTEDLEERLDKTVKQKKDLEREIEQLAEKQKNLETQMEKVNLKRVEELEQSRLLETELKQLRKRIEDGCTERNKHTGDLERENKILIEDLSKLKQDILCKQNELDKLHETFKETTEKLKETTEKCKETTDKFKSQEKELRKQDSINKRNREEMENWKQERDACVSKLEQHINKRQQENKQLVHEIEQLKKDNAELANNVGNVTSMKDSVIADLRKINNTLSIQLARVQGMSPPPKIATPDNSTFNRNEFIEDLDTTGHLEIDATPPVAAKKCRKRQGSSRQIHSSPSATSSVDTETFMTPVSNSLRPIEEQNENSPNLNTRNTSPTKSSFQGRVAELASEVIASISPLTRSARKLEKENRKKQKSGTQAPFDLASYVAASEVQNENANPYSTRRSSRLRTRTKHSVL